MIKIYLVIDKKNKHLFLQMGQGPNFSSSQWLLKGWLHINTMIHRLIQRILMSFDLGCVIFVEKVWKSLLNSVDTSIHLLFVKPNSIAVSLWCNTLFGNRIVDRTSTVSIYGSVWLQKINTQRPLRKRYGKERISLSSNLVMSGVNCTRDLVLAHAVT